MAVSAQGGTAEWWIFRIEKKIEAWLRTQPREVAVTLAARAAGRVLPALVISRESRRFVELALASLRAIALTRIAVGWPNRVGELRAAAANAGAAAYAAKASAYAARASAYATTAAYAVADAAADAVYSARATAAYSDIAAAAAAAANAIDAATAAARAADVDDDDARTALSADAESLSNRQPLGALWPAKRELNEPLPGLRRTLPDFFLSLWRYLKSILLARSGENWSVWTDWYDAWLEGREQFPQLSPKSREDLDVAICLIPNEDWEKGPAHVNAIIRNLIDAALARAEPLQPIPRQVAGPHFGIGADDRIELVGAENFDEQGNNLPRLRQLLPQVLNCVGDLKPSLAGNKYPVLAKSVERYEAALVGKDVRVIEWGLVWGLGVRLVNAADATEREIADRILPELEDEGKEALTSLRDLHQPMILASAEGRELQEESDRAQATRAEIEQMKRNAQALAASLENDRAAVNEEAAQTVKEAAEAAGEGRHPERGFVFAFTTIKNIGVTLVTTAAASAVIYGAGVMIVSPDIAKAVQIGVGFLEWECLKRIPQVSAAFEAIGKGVGRGWTFGEDRAKDEFLRRTAHFRDYVVRNEKLLRDLAATTPKMGWMTRYIDFIVEAEKAARH